MLKITHPIVALQSPPLSQLIPRFNLFRTMPQDGTRQETSCSWSALSTLLLRVEHSSTTLNVHSRCSLVYTPAAGLARTEYYDVLHGKTILPSSKHSRAQVLMIEYLRYSQSP